MDPIKIDASGENQNIWIEPELNELNLTLRQGKKIISLDMAQAAQLATKLIDHINYCSQKYL